MFGHVGDGDRLAQFSGRSVAGLSALMGHVWGIVRYHAGIPRHPVYIYIYIYRYRGAYSICIRLW